MATESRVKFNGESPASLSRRVRLIIMSVTVLGFESVLLPSESVTLRLGVRLAGPEPRPGDSECHRAVQPGPISAGPSHSVSVGEQFKFWQVRPGAQAAQSRLQLNHRVKFQVQ